MSARAPAAVHDPAPWKLVAALTTAGLVSGAVLAGVHAATAPAIADNQARALQRAVLAVVPGAHSFEPAHVSAESPRASGEGGAVGEGAYRVRDADGRSVGFAIEAQGPGFADTIRLLYGLRPETGTVVGLRILDSRETPGLGDKIKTDPAFVGSFEALQVQPRIVPVTRGPRTRDNEVDCISGATISSKAVVGILDASVHRWLPRLAAAEAEEP